MTRRLPVYLLLDTSESMAGEPHQSLEAGIYSLLNLLKSDPRCLETVHLCVITFGAKARIALPLTPIDSFTMPKLSLGTGTPLGAALELLLTSINTDLRGTSKGDVKGDWRPLIFIVSDGKPTDSWESRAKELREKTNRGSCVTVALACGQDADSTALHRLTPNVFRCSADTSSLSSFFKWVTSSIKTASLGIAEVAGASGPESPRELRRDVEGKAETTPWLYLVGRCQVKKLPFVQKHRWNGAVFSGTEAVALREIEIGESVGLDIDAGSIDSKPCPHCENQIWAYCSCTRIFCCPGTSGHFTCPWCNESSDYLPSSFSLRGSGG